MQPDTKRVMPILIYFLDNFLHITSNHILDTSFRFILYQLFVSFTTVLIGYNNYSYIRGVSSIAQRNFVILGFLFLILFGIDFLAGYHGYYEPPY